MYITFFALMKDAKKMNGHERPASNGDLVIASVNSNVRVNKSRAVTNPGQKLRTV
jgi:hypothetical protein